MVNGTIGLAFIRKYLVLRGAESAGETWEASEQHRSDLHPGRTE